MQRFNDLRVWQRSHALVLAVYRLSDRFPRSERFGLTTQLRRAAVSVPTNVAEGSKRRGQADYARFVNVAEGSIAETEYLLMLSRDLGYATPDEVGLLLAETTEIARMLNALHSRIQQGDPAP
jgi:four helix bundle protein